MADSFTVEIRGMDRLERAFRNLERSVQADSLEAAAKVGAEVIRSEAVRIVVVKTGNLRASLTTEVKNRSASEVTVAIGPGRQAPYGRHVELGTSRMRAQPYLRPAFDARKREAADEAGKALRRQILGSV